MKLIHSTYLNVCMIQFRPLSRKFLLYMHTEILLSMIIHINSKRYSAVGKGWTGEGSEFESR
jgi:hypothetical protein